MAKTLNSHTREAVKVWRDISKGREGKLWADELRSALEDAGISCVNKDGSAKDDAGIRLALNKFLGTLRDVGVRNGKWEDEEAAKDWTDERFKQAKTRPTMDDFTDVINELD